MPMANLLITANGELWRKTTNLNKPGAYKKDFLQGNFNACKFT
jgi:hypothetical protein